MAVKKIELGSDHAGAQLKEEIIEHLNGKGYEIKDFGTSADKPADYPDPALAVAESVVSGEFDRGILCCGTGIGISIAANKVPGVRCAMLSDTFSARATRLHNDANVMALGGRVIGPELAKDIVDMFLETEFSGVERHQKRIDKIAEIEKKYSK